jgi:polysaccharide chain length determinant protein (PEP-CTERM system associated)
MLPGKAYKPEDVLQILFRRIWLLLVPLAVVGAVAAVVVHSLPDKYRSETVILVVPQRVPESFVRSTVTTRIEDRLQSLNQEIMSRTRLEKIIQDFDLYARERKTGIMEDIVEQMRRDIDLQVVRGDAFKISYVGSNPRTVMRVTERLGSLFIDESIRDRSTLAENTSAFLGQQLEEARQRLVEHEKKLEAYRQQYAGQLPSQLDSNLQVLQGVQLQIQSLVESINHDRDRQLILQRQIADLEQQEDAAAAAGEQAPADGGSAMVQQLAIARANLTVLQTRLKPDHPDVKKASGLVRELEAKVAAEQGATPVTAAAPSVTSRSKRLQDYRTELELLERQLANKQADQQRLQDQIGSYQARVEAAPRRESEMTELTRDYVTLQQMYTSLLTKREDSKIAESLEQRQIGEQFKTLDPARLPEKPFSPNRPRLTAMGLAAGLGVGLLLIGLLEYRDQSFKADHEVVRLLALPVLAVVPTMQSAAEKKWMFRKRLLIGSACTTTIFLGLAVVAYTFIF